MRVTPAYSALYLPIRKRSTVLLAAAALHLASCATADRTGARRIADTGSGIASALVEEVDARQHRLRDAAADDSFNFAYTTMAKCQSASGAPAITRAGAPAGQNGDCDVLQVAEARKQGRLPMTAAQLADIVGKRAVAARALGDAYRAFAAEAEYDAAADMEDAVGKATAAVNQFASAVGLGSIAPVATEAVTLLAGAGADRAQRHRLLAANTQLRAVSGHMRTALEREKLRHQAIDAIVTTLDAETRRNLVRAGLLNAVPTMRGIADRAGLSVVADNGMQAAMARDPVLGAAAEVATLARLRVRQPDALDAAISALAALDVQHAEYARGRSVSMKDAAAALSRLAIVARAAQK